MLQLVERATDSLAAFDDGKSQLDSTGLVVLCTAQSLEYQAL